MKNIGFTVEDSLAAKIANGYTSTYKGALSSVKNWYKIRSALMPEIKKGLGKEGIKTLEQLNLPQDCSVTVFDAIIGTITISDKADRFLSSLDYVGKVVLIDMMLTGGLQND